MQNPEPPDRLMRPSEAKELFGVTAKTLRLWNIAGVLGAQRTAGGQRRYPQSQVRALAAQLGQEAGR
jgi:DNA-binding transcriptional MerR regulator